MTPPAKIVLLQEIHHRVKNNLQIICSLLDMQADTLDDERAIAKLHDSQDRIRSMALIHEVLYQHDEMSAIDLSEYVKNLRDQLFSSYSQSNLIKLPLGFILGSTHD